MPPDTTKAAGRPRYEVADIFRAYGDAYRRSYSLPLSHLKVMRSIEVCRTAYLGGHVEQCDSCGFERIAYNSCRNRHCPKCQSLAKAEWLEKCSAELLPAEYFHNVFTIPHELNTVALFNKKVIFDILFKSVARTLKEFAADPKHRLGGRIGFTAILHTWDQKLRHHIHLHCLIPAGALSFDSSRWVHASKNFLFPVKALSKVFRGKFIDFLKRAFAEGKLVGTEEGFSSLIDHLWKKDWVVYSRAPFGGPAKVLDYLGRYTHRVAIANHRIVKIKDGFVTFRYRDRADGDKRKEMTLSAEEFIRRFLLHVLPDYYMRIRHFGFLSNRCKKRDLPICRELLGVSPNLPEVLDKTMQERMLQLTGIDVVECPHCKEGHMIRVAELPRLSESDSVRYQNQPEILDSS